MRDQPETWLVEVDNRGLPGKFKAWIDQHCILPLLWSLLVYDILLSIVEGFRRKISHFLRRWLGLPCSLNSITLYGRKNMLQLPFTSLSEEFMVHEER